MGLFHGFLSIQSSPSVHPLEGEHLAVALRELGHQFAERGATLFWRELIGPLPSPEGDRYILWCVGGAGGARLERPLDVVPA